MVGGRERDGIYVTEDVVHLLECTTSRQKAKAEGDLTKLFDLYNKYKTKYSDRAIKCWFVTKYEPTADQRNCRKAFKRAPENLFNIVSFAQFQSKLIDSRDYLQCRDNHKFGSIYDPKTGNPTADVKYIQVALRVEGEEEPRGIENLANTVLTGGRITLLGEYGVGKSMTLREIYKQLAADHQRSRTARFPIFLNLREHQGQGDATEILERHARNIGFPKPFQLVRAWKAGYAVLLLDGFDEVSSAGLQGAWRKLQTARFASMQGVRQLLEESPEGTGIAIAGRQHFFDTESERVKALGQRNADWKLIRLNEFNEHQIGELTRQFGYQGTIPAWVPSRPLLLSSLFAKGLGEGASEQLAVLRDPAAGWDFLLDEVSSREARIESGIDGANIRAILESLATLARRNDSGLGPITSDQIVEVFQAECEFNPTDEALSVLQRLPGLGRDDSAAGEARIFVDSEFADACAAGDFSRFCENPYDQNLASSVSKLRAPLKETGIGLVSRRLENQEFGQGHLRAIMAALEKNDNVNTGATPADVFSLGLKQGLEFDGSLFVADLHLGSIEVDKDGAALERVTFAGCIVERLSIAEDAEVVSFPTFRDCLIQEVEGRISEEELPKTKFFGCLFESFSEQGLTVNSVLELKIPVGAKVLITVLKKLFVQSLGGRKENALYRGLDTEHQSKVGEIIELLLSHGMVTNSGRSGETIWIPVRRQTARALDIIASPSGSKDKLMVEARKI